MNLLQLPQLFSTTLQYREKVNLTQLHQKQAKGEVKFAYKSKDRSCFEIEAVLGVIFTALPCGE